MCVWVWVCAWGGVGTRQRSGDEELAETLKAFIMHLRQRDPQYATQDAMDDAVEKGLFSTAAKVQLWFFHFFRFRFFRFIFCVRACTVRFSPPPRRFLVRSGFRGAVTLAVGGRGAQLDGADLWLFYGWDRGGSFFNFPVVLFFQTMG